MKMRSVMAIMLLVLTLTTSAWALDIDADDNDAVDRQFGGTNVDFSASPGDHRGLGFNNSSGAMEWFELGSGLDFGTSPFSLDLAMEEPLGAWGSITDGDPTPDVSSEWSWKLTDDGTTDVDTITALDGGSDGMVRYLLFTDAYWIVDCTGTTINCNGGADWSPAANDTMICINDGTVWNCIVAVAAGAGDVVALASWGADNMLVRTHQTGKTIQDTGIEVDDSDKITAPGGFESSTASVGTVKFWDSGGDHGATVTVAGDWAADRTFTLREAGGDKDVGITETQKDFTLHDPADADDALIFKAQHDMTITDIHCIADGGTSISLDIQECTSAGASCATVDAAITCDTDGAEDACSGSCSNGSIDAGDWVKMILGAPSGSVDVLTFSIYYTDDY